MENYHEWLMREVATLDNANRWNDTPEKFIFCLDLLELSLCKNGDQYCEYFVCKLENRFIALLKPQLVADNNWSNEYFINTHNTSPR